MLTVFWDTTSTEAYPVVLTEMQTNCDRKLGFLAAVLFVVDAISIQKFCTAHCWLVLLLTYRLLVCMQLERS